MSKDQKGEDCYHKQMMKQEDIVQMRMPMHIIKWCGLYDKNSDKMYVPTQLLLQCTHEQKHNEKNDGQMTGLRELQDGAKYVMKE